MKYIWILTIFLATLGTNALADDAAPAASKPGPVTIHLDATHPNDIIAEITKQTGVKFNIWPENLWEQYKNNRGNGPPTAIDLNVDNKPFWEMMQQFCAAAKMSPSNMGQGDVISLQFNSGGDPFSKHPVSVSDNATFVVQVINRNHSINFGSSDDPQVERQCGVQITGYLDPRLRVTKFQHQLNIEKAEDDTGKSIAGPNNRGNSSQSPDTTWQMNGLFVPLDYDTQSSKKLASLKGSVRATAATEVERLELDLASAQGTSKEVGGRTILIDSVKDENNSISVGLTIVRTDMPKEQFREVTNGIFQAVNLLSADGKRRNNSGGGGGGDDKITYNFQASYQKDEEKPVKLVWDIPTKIEDIDLPFEFKDLPLP